MLFGRALRYITAAGSLKLTDASGRTYEFCGSDGPRIVLRLLDPALNRKFITNPWLHTGEAYMDGTLVIEEGTVGDVLEYLCINAAARGGDMVFALDRWLNRRTRWLQQYNPARRARRNVAHHYDLSGALYELFLDSDRQYSCAYFSGEHDTLDQAQDNKKRHIAAKLLLEPGQKVLDIGSGWGGLGLYLAGLENIEVTGITLSEEQQRTSRERAREAGLADRVGFHLRNYREVEGCYDRIVSVGMFEHVGIVHYRQFFATLKRLLAEDGVCLLHSIFRMEPPGTTNPWMRKYIFPGGYTPAMSEVLEAIEHERLYVADIEILRLHYAETLKHWYRRFQANRDAVAELYDERFCRMWEWYLKGCEMSFRHSNLSVFQMQIARRQEAVPVVRDYVTDWERARGRDRKDGTEVGHRRVTGACAAGQNQASWIVHRDLPPARHLFPDILDIHLYRWAA